MTITLTPDEDHLVLEADDGGESLAIHLDLAGIQALIDQLEEGKAQVVMWVVAHA